VVKAAVLHLRASSGAPTLLRNPKYRLDDLLHRNRQYNVGMTGRCGPLKIMNDKCLQIAPGLHHLVAVLVVREWIAADSTACAGVLKHLDNARHWN